MTKTTTKDVKATKNEKGTKPLNPGAAKAKAAAQARREAENKGTAGTGKEQTNKPDVDIRDGSILGDADALLDSIVKGETSLKPEVLENAPKGNDNPVLNTAGNQAEFNPESFVVVDGDNVTVNYPDADYSLLKLPTLEEIKAQAEQVQLTDANAYDNPLTAVRTGDLSRFVTWLQRTFNGNKAELEQFVQNVIVSASMIPVLAVRETIDAAARNVVENQAAEKRRLAKEEEDRIAREAVLEMQDTMIKTFMAKGMDAETAKRKAEEILAPKQSRSTGTGTGSQFNYNRVLIKCGEHEFEMGERGFHPKLAQELWEKEGISKEEFVKKYTVRVIRQGTV